MTEPRFLAPWSAIEQATDLALELGEPSQIVVNDFALSVPKKVATKSKSVRFAEQVQVFQGKGHAQCSGHTWHGLNDRDSFCVADDVPHLMFGRQDASQPSGSSTPGAHAPVRTSHLLDQRLPTDLAGYIHHLQQIWRDEHVRLPTSDSYALRTWFIHHEHQRLWKVPRVVQLPADPRLWHDLLLRLWQDQLHNDQPLNVAVVFPRVRVQSSIGVTHADVILTQGAHDMCGGLVTVYPPGTEDDMYYVWAASYPRHVSGRQILNGVEAEELVQTHGCDLFHGGIVIPITTQPTHYMANGHSFVAVFHDLDGPVHPSSSSSATAANPIVHASEADDENEPIAEAPEESSGVPSSSFDEEDLQGLQIFGLHQQVHHCFVRWRTYNILLFDILHSLGLHRDLAIGHHYIPVQLVDQHDAEEAVILQRVGDVPSGSDDRLVLVDITFQARVGRQRSYYRRVRLLSPQSTRNEVFGQLRLQNPYVQYPDDCQMFLNEIPWVNAAPPGQGVHHGAYVRIVVQGTSNAECTSQMDESALKRRRMTYPNPSSGSTFHEQDGAAMLQSDIQVHSHSSSRAMIDPMTMPLSSPQRFWSRTTCPDQVLSSQPYGCSAMFSSLATRHQTPASTASTPTRPSQTRPREWMIPLRVAFVEALTAAAGDESYEFVVTTWYLHHGRYPRNMESRLLSLDRHSTLWYQDLCDLWAAIMDPYQEAQVHFVSYGPPPDASSPVPVHLLLVQGHSPLVPVLLTALFEHELHQRMWHLAALISEFATISEVWDILGINRFCAVRQCRTHVNSQYVSPHVILQAHSGDHVQVTISPQQNIAVHDAVSLMQQTPASSTCSRPCIDVDKPSHSIRVDGDYRWHAGLDDAFHHSAVVEIEEEGPALYVWTWFLHHRSFRTCEAPRIVRLVRSDEDWLDCLLTPWKDHLQKDILTSIRIVDARPPHEMMRIDTVHIMIEQEPGEPIIAGVVSVLFQEDKVDRLLQRAYSLPRWLCTEDLISFMELNPICDVQRCSARVGRIPMEKYIRHDLPTAVSIEMRVRPAQCHGDPHAASSSALYVPRPTMPVSGRSLMQITRRWQRVRRQQQDDSGTAPHAHLADEHHCIPQRIAEGAAPTFQQPPMIAPMWPTTWTSLHDVWHFFFAQLHRPADLHIQVAVWYSDHLRRPWSEDYRLVTLNDQIDTWNAQIVQAWHDWFLAEQAYDIHVVRPVPLGANEEAQFHVILLQQPQPLHKSIIVTVMDSFTDPWQPAHIAVVVPNVIDHWALLHVAVVEFQCPPVVSTAQCSTFFGRTDLTAGNLFPVQHGMCMTVTVETTTTTTSLEQIDHIDFEHTPDVMGTSLLQIGARLREARRKFEVLQSHKLALLDSLAAVEDSSDQLVQPTEKCDTRADVDSMTFPSTFVRESQQTEAIADPCSAVQGNIQGHTIRLSSLLPPPTWTIVDCTSIAALRQRLCERDPPAVKYDLSDVPCTPSVVAALNGLYTWTSEIPLAFEFYTDGAFRRSREVAASGVVLIVYTYDGPRFGGYLTSWCLATPSAPRAEVTAVTLAAHWASHLVLQLGFVYTKIVFLFDNVYAGSAAQGRCAFNSNDDVTPLVRSLVLWLEQLSFIDIAWHHVKGHSDHPWNDLADAVAYDAISRHAVTTDIDALVQCCLGPGNDLVSMQWLWLYEKSLRGDADAPVLHGFQWRFNVAAPLGHCPDASVQPFELR